jgi:two-component system NtrC family sensor kinase
VRKLLFVFCLFVSSNVFAAVQKDTANGVTINSLGKGGLPLNHGWKFHPGDDPAFARNDYNDNNWQNIDPGVRIPLLPRPAQQGIGWLRLKLHVAPGLRRNAFITIVQSTAVEIYLNGKLIGLRGTIDNRHKTGHGYYDSTNPIELPLSDEPEQTLAIRFAHQPRFNFINRNLFGPVLSVVFYNTPQLISSIGLSTNVEVAVFIGISILLLLGIIHIVLFRYNSKKRANLYFACYAIFFSAYLFLAISTFFPQYYDVFICLALLNTAVYALSALFVIKALYLLFEFNTGWYYWFLIVLSSAAVLIWMFNEQLYSYALWGLTILLNITELVLTIKAVIVKRRGAYIISAGFLTGLIGILGLIYLVDFWSIPVLSIISICMAALGPALGISVFLGREFALDSKLLGVKLVQVEELSAMNMTQEIEKQQLLARQNETLELQVTERTAALQLSMTELKQTQNQLIQSAKMASLGELTAGIAHEIQNPLNFVNNFSEVNNEMIVELEDELKSGNIDEALLIAADIKGNEQKIHQHGKRADAIVKGMLQHSRASGGNREVTNINALADEHMRLSYHGFRAKDKSFNSELITHFDPDLPKINVVQQDIGRVLLNLFNNAFYAVNQKSKTAVAGYKPEVTVSTAAENGNVVIKVKDNGIGIPDAIKEKIMQPFFTTKPTGEGTGLGLSLTYDMVVKGHGGSIKVESKEGQGSEFIILLPLN